MSFTYVDLFAGIGGFHAAMSALGGELRMAVEIDPYARDTYKRNWGADPEHDVVTMANERLGDVGPHTVLAGGFPCQPFSKSGRQRGMGEERGQLFHEIVKILEEYRPAVVALENVRNITGPRQQATWKAIVDGLRDVGYRVPSEPCVVSPHRLPPRLGGAPQSRDRVYILGTYVGRDRAVRESDVAPVVHRVPEPDWTPDQWNLEDLVGSGFKEVDSQYAFTAEEWEWIAVWNDFLTRIGNVRLPGFPMWSSYWEDEAGVDSHAPLWKQAYERKNLDFYRENRIAIRGWIDANPRLRTFPKSRQKLEWQAQDSHRDLTKCLLHLRPSGIRVKRMTYSPALVAMAQTPLIGPLGRRMTPRETAHLQGFPDWFELDHQSDTRSYRQLGNAINIGAAYYAFRKHVLRDAVEILDQSGGTDLVNAVRNSTASPVIPRPAN